MRNFPFLLILFLFFSEHVSGQIFRYRLCGNSGFFLGETAEEVSHPDAVNAHPGSRDFSNVYKTGAEAEIMAPITTDFELGVEFDYSRLSGYTETAPLYNFFLTRYNPLLEHGAAGYSIYPDEALVYNTTLLNILGSARFYFLPVDENLNLFFRAFGGVAFIGTDFTFDDPQDQVASGVGVLYSQGTKSNEEPKEAVFNGGAGAGLTVRITDKWDIYLEGNVSMIHSDIVNGVPNFDYTVSESTEALQRAQSWSLTGQVSLGVIFSAIPDRRLNKGNYTRSRRSSKRLFWKRKRSNPFSKRR